KPAARARRCSPIAVSLVCTSRGAGYSICFSESRNPARFSGFLASFLLPPGERRPAGAGVNYQQRERPPHAERTLHEQAHPVAQPRETPLRACLRRGSVETAGAVVSEAPTGNPRPPEPWSHRCGDRVL